MFKGDMVNEFGKEMYEIGYDVGYFIGYMKSVHDYRIGVVRRFLSECGFSDEEIAYFSGSSLSEVIHLKNQG